MRRHRIIAFLAAALTLTACGPAEPEETGRTEGLFYEASGISPDAPVLTVDGRETPAWRYCYWLARGCDQLRQAYEAAGAGLNWSETVDGESLSAYAHRQAVENTALYATVENWAERWEVTLTEADQRALTADWTKKCEDAGGEAAYLAALAPMGLGREEAEALAEDACLYRKLSALFAQAGSGLAPTEAETEAFAREAGYLTVDWLAVQVGAEEDREACRQQAASLFAQLNGSADPLAAFEALAASCAGPDRSLYPRGQTFLPENPPLPENVAAAAQVLEEGQWSGILEAADGFYILLRRPLDASAVLADFFDSRLQAAAAAAEIQCAPELEALEVPAFYERLTTARRDLADQEK